MRQWQVGILLFNEVEVMDFAGPFEVFSIARYPGHPDGDAVKPFVVKTVAQTKELIKTRYQLQVLPDFDFGAAPPFDILIIPGGYGAEEVEIRNPKLIAWIQQRAQQVQLLASVCTGAFLLAEAGLLDGKRATTHWLDIDRLAGEYPRVSVQRGVKYVDEGSVMTAGGISAGINLSFYIMEKLLGAAIAQTAARRMEYDLPQ